MVTSNELMASFAARTGLTGSRPQRRYLWTDAFAVCNFLELGQIDLALRLIDRVHRELGRYRADDARQGWLSGLSELEGAAHPTFGGLRIGKPLAERGPDEPVDNQLEWDRDGQYFHYLTKWMHALARAARVTGNANLARWARELADTAHRHFVYQIHGQPRMYWKMSVDLQRPQVASMGHHDPLDGYVTCVELDAMAAAFAHDGADLRGAAANFRSMIDVPGLATTDPLGIGGLLVDAHRLAQLDRDRELAAAMVRAARSGLQRYAMQPDLELPADHRLAFRELGLAIGLAAVVAMNADDLAEFVELRDVITEFWRDPAHRGTRSYRAHEDINDVMLATSLQPQAFLSL